MRNIVIIDNGHGTRKYTKGKRSPDESLFEGEWNREIAKRLVPALEEIGFTAVLLVPEDEDIPLQKRCDRVNNIVKLNPHDNIIFISIHINAGPDSGWSNASGASVYVCREASQKSVDLAHCYYDYVEEFGLKGNRNVPAERVWRANYFVLKNTHCPAILTENLFMTNRNEVKYLLSEKGKETIVNLHIAAICKYFNVPCAVCVG